VQFADIRYLLRHQSRSSNRLVIAAVGEFMLEYNIPSGTKQKMRPSFAD